MRSSSSSAAAAVTTSLSAYPTILVGCGGLGGYIVRQVHAQKPGDHVTYMIVDTDAPKVEHGGSGGFSGLLDLDALDSNLQIVRMAGVDLGEWRQSHANILDGIFPMDLPSNLASGAAKKRLFGSAAGWEASEEIYRTLESAMKRVRREEGMDNRVIRLRVISGTSGGTGSANILKICMIANQVFRDNWDAGQVSLEIQIMLVLPDCYNVDGSLRSIVEVNGAYCLRELAHAQREGLTLVFPQRTVSVPPGFLHKAICIGASSTVKDITETAALEQLATALLMDADAAMGKAIRDEDVDVIGNLPGTDHFVSGVGAYNLHVIGSQEMARAMFRRKVAQAFIGLPDLPASALSGLTAALVPTSFTEIKASVNTPNLTLNVNDVIRAGSGVLATITQQMGIAQSGVRDEIASLLASKQPTDAGNAVRGFIHSHAGRFNLRSIASALRGWVTRLQVSVPLANDANLRSSVTTVATEMEEAYTLESRKATFGEGLGKLFGGAGKPKPSQSSKSLAGSIIATAEGHLEQSVQRILAEAWNAYISGLTRDVQAALVDAETSFTFFEAEARRAINPPTLPEAHDYRQVVVVRPEDVERLLPAIDCVAMLGDKDILIQAEAVLAFTGSISTEQIMMSHPEILRRVDQMLRSEAMLSYSAARCDQKPGLRYFVSGPEALRRHPRVMELESRKQLRWVENRGDQICVVAMVYGVKPGAIAGVDTWEKRTVGGDNLNHVSMIPALKYPPLVQVKEALVVEPFLVALVAGMDLPFETDLTNPWSYCSPDALLRKVGDNGDGRWVFQPYPGKGRQAIEVGNDLASAWQCFLLDLDGVRSMATHRARDLIAGVGIEAVVLQVSEFAAVLSQELDRRNTEITENGKPTDPAGARKLHQLTQVRDQVRELWERTNRWLEDKKRATAKR